MNEEQSKGIDTQPSGRRAVLKAAATATPMILTLGSNSALAVSSNLISTSTPLEAKDIDGKTLCLDDTSVTMVDADAGIYDFGPYVEGTVNRIPDREHMVQGADGLMTPITEDQMCTQGGLFSYTADGALAPTEVNVPRGILVSSAALASFYPGVNYMDR